MRLHWFDELIKVTTRKKLPLNKQTAQTLSRTKFKNKKTNKRKAPILHAPAAIKELPKTT